MKHGKRNTRLYRLWASMRCRCNCVTSENYQLYGAKGIKVCKEWNEFIVFEKWAINNGYKEYLSLDRINNNYGYCPDNCRWATKKQQSENRSVTVWITFEGQTKTASEWSRDNRCKVHPDVFRHNIKKGYSIEESWEYRADPIIYQYNGKSKTIKEWSKDPICVVSFETLRKRLRRYKYSIEKALKTPLQSRNI